MDTVIVIATILMGWAFALIAQFTHRADLQALEAAHAAALQQRDERIDSLLAQVQLNSQNMPYYPQVGPAEPVPEKTYLHSDDGFISIELDDAVDEVAR